jgi:hypothetical protein
MNDVRENLTLNFGNGVRHSFLGLDIRALLWAGAAIHRMGTGEMKTSTALVALVLATAVAGSANAATKHHAQHHHAMHIAKGSTASTTDWPGNPYMDLQQRQVEKFWHDAFDPYDATKTTK